MNQLSKIESSVDLSIVIPTYSRARHLALTLDSLLVACERAKGSGSCEIIVLDNQSFDSTREVVDERRRRFPIEYRLSPTFVTADVNAFNAQRTGRGGYVWVLGDDDPPLPNALERIYEGIKHGNDFLILNYWFNGSMKVALAAEPWFGRIKSEALPGANEVLGRLGGDVGFISAVVARRALWQSTSFAEQERWLPLHFHQVYAFYKTLHGSPLRGELIGEPVLVTGLAERVVENSLSWERAFIEGLGLIFDELEQQVGYDCMAAARARSATFNKFVLPKIAAARLNGQEWRNAERSARLKLRQPRCSSIRDVVVTELPTTLLRVGKFAQQVLGSGRRRLKDKLTQDATRQMAEAILSTSRCSKSQ